MRRYAILLSAAAVGFSTLLAAGVSHAMDFTFESYFKGRTTAVGSFSAINGVKRSFKVDLRGHWDGRKLTLREDFVYDNNERDTKTWRFTKTSPTTYSGTREDVVGKTRVVLKGDTARFSYLVYLDPKAKKNLVRFSDVMTLQPDGTVVNTATVTKFGIPVARTRVVFKR